MILLFRIISDEDQDFFRDLVIDSSDTFLDFHNVLQENLAYDPTQLASFFITTENWEKENEITLIDMMPDQDGLASIMGEVCLEEFISEVNQRMIYVYDFFSERAFFMELIETSDETSSRKTPFVANQKGDPPVQLALDRLLDEADPTQLDEDAYDRMDDLRLDDLDLDLLDSGNPEDY